MSLPPEWFGFFPFRLLALGRIRSDWPVSALEIVWFTILCVHRNIYIYFIKIYERMGYTPIGCPQTLGQTERLPLLLLCSVLWVTDFYTGPHCLQLKRIIVSRALSLLFMYYTHYTCVYAGHKKKARPKTVIGVSTTVCFFFLFIYFFFYFACCRKMRSRSNCSNVLAFANAWQVEKWINLRTNSNEWKYLFKWYPHTLCLDALLPIDGKWKEQQPTTIHKIDEVKKNNHDLLDHSAND